MVYIIFLIFAQNIDYGYSLEPPRQGGSNEYPQSMFWAEIWKYQNFLSENFHFLVVKFSAYLNRRVFVMIRLYVLLKTLDPWIPTKCHAKILIRCAAWSRPRGYKTFFVLISAEHENFSANNMKMPTTVEHEKSFITSGPGLCWAHMQSSTVRNAVPGLKWFPIVL